jgi:hypothetical protein
MERFRTKINQLLVEQAGPKKRAFTRTFTTKPAADLERKFGRLFGLFEIEASEGIAEQLFNVIVEEIRTNFYYALRPGMATTEELTLEETLERALQKTNQAIAAFVEAEQVTVDVNRLNICLGCARAEEVHFAFTGKMNVFIIHPLKTGQFRIANILDGSASSAGPTNPLKLFSQILSGKVRRNDIMVLTTSNVLDYFSLDRIKNLLTQQSVVEGLGKLKDLFPKANLQENFAVATIELEPVPIAQPKPALTPPPLPAFGTVGPKESMHELIQTERDTEKLLTPSLMPELKKHMSGLTGRIAEQFRGSGQRRSIPGVPPRVPALQHNNQLFGAGARRRGQGMLYSVRQRLGGMGQKISAAPGLRVIAQVGQNVARPIQQRLSHLPPQKRRSLVLAVTLGVIFVVGVGGLIFNQRISAARAQVQAVLDQAQQMQAEAVASLIYRDEGQARAQLTDARNLVQQTKPKNATQREQQQSLLTTINDQLVKLQHIENFAEPIVIGNFKNLDPEAQITPGLWRIGTDVVVYNHHASALYRANIDNQTLNQTAVAPALTVAPTLAIADQPNQILLFAGNQASTIRPTTGASASLTFNLPANSTIVDVVTYNGRLYILDSTSGQVFRYTATNAGYRAAGTPWITDASATLPGGTSITVDGILYGLAGDGRVAKLENGKPSAFAAQVIDPALTTPKKIRTTANFIYILDPQNHRVVVMDKAGKLIRQYTSDKFDQLQDMIIDEGQRRAFLQNGAFVYGIPLSHL